MSNRSHGAAAVQPQPPAYAPDRMDPATLAAENAELRIRLQEMEETLLAIHSGKVDSLVLNNGIFLLESVGLSSQRIRQDVLGQMADAVFAFDNEEHLIFINAAAEQRYGLRAGEALGRKKPHLFTEVAVDGAAPGGGAPPAQRSHVPAVHVLRNGQRLHVESSQVLLVDDGGHGFGVLEVVRDVTQNHRAQVRKDALAQLTEALRDVDQEADVGYVAAQIIGLTLDAGRAGYGQVDLGSETMALSRDWVGPSMHSLAGTLHLRDYGTCLDDLKRNSVVNISDVYTDHRTAYAPEGFVRAGVRAVLAVPVFEGGQLVAFVFVNDAKLRHSKLRHWMDDDVQLVQEIAERARVAAERIRNAVALRASEARLREVNEGLEAAVLQRTTELLKAQEALRQAQKMEAVGQLTGGIAHDFNNLLAGTSVSLEVLQRRLAQGQVNEVERYLQMSKEGIKRAAALTQRLLAFARRQTLDPKPTSLNCLVSGLQELVRRTMGPQVELNVEVGEGLWQTLIDVSQLENSLLNLCINARDAMVPSGGHLTIATANITLDAHDAVVHDLLPGQYVTLSVTDTGTGIPAELLDRIFDPFFTTKPTGQGTGLGLSMVYGFVRQSGGQVRVASVLGRGTTMCLYFPRYFGEGEAMEPNERTAVAHQGHGKHIVLIEDEATIRAVLAEVLQEAGYQVSTAEDGPSGLQILQRGGSVDMLVTDVGLPGGLNGRQVADAARVTRPLLKVLFITGYADKAAVGNGLLEPGMEVLTKPFELSDLTDKLEAMFAPPSQQPGR
ncbi:ATP-binding protein [Comamonas sp. J-3]|uniref:ATP-binding protein n=1 Tax=Comamonas trifloxystrobinivorans TaxID=3350256 RepID=UPI003729E2C5